MVNSDTNSDTNISLKIKNCPFCGYTANVDDVLLASASYNFIVRCGDCGATGPSEVYERDAIEKWNKRVEDKFKEALQRISNYKKKTDLEDDYQSIISVQTIAEDVLYNYVLIPSDKRSEDDSKTE